MLKLKKPLLEAEFKPEDIYERNHSGETLHYIRNGALINRLNQVYGNGQWSFEALEHIFLKGEVVVKGCLTVNGVKHTQYGNAQFGYNQQLSAGDAIKAATSNSLLRCTLLLGVGLYLRQSPEKTMVNATELEPEPLSKRQIKFVVDLATKQQLTTEKVDHYCQSHYGRPLDLLDKQQASELITFLQEGRVELTQVA